MWVSRVRRFRELRLPVIVSVGGTWYTGTNFPEQYRNLYYFADWGHAIVNNLALDQNDKPFALGSFMDNAGSVVCMTQHPTDGSLYYVTYNDISGRPQSSSFRMLETGHRSQWHQPTCIMVRRR